MITHSGHQEIHLRDYLYVLRKRKLVIFVFFVVVVAGSFVFTYFEKVLYRANATILIERENPNVVDFKEVMAFDASTTDYYQTQYEMLENRSLIEALIEKEKLEQDPYLLGLQKGGFVRSLQKQKFFPPWLQEFLGKRPVWDLFLRRMLKVEPIRNTRLVHVSVIHPDPEKSAQLTNSLVELFIQKNLENRFFISRQATQMIASQLSELKEKVGEAERKLQSYKEEHKLINIPSIREQDKFIQDAKLELVKIQAEESKLAKRYLPDHPKRIHIRSQIEGLDEKIKEEQSKNMALSRVAIDYAELEREAESARQIYEALLSRLEETHTEAKMQASNILIVDPAKPATRPYTPRPFLNFLIAIAVGLSGGILLAFFNEYLDSTVKIPDDIEKGLGLDLFGIIPSGDRVSKGPAHGEIFLSADQHTPTSESFRALRTALLFRLRHTTGTRKLLVTSPNPEEGKSTVVLNLASAFQQNHLKVLLIDADLRKPRLHKLFDFPVDNGLTDILEGELEVSQAIHQNVSELGFDFLSCGSLSHHPTEILGSDEMKKLLEELEKTYDIILMDSPPYLAVADVAVLTEFSDALIIVARHHKTDKRHLKDCKRRFSEINHKLIGVVINDVSVREKDYYYHQYYYYGYGDASQTR